MAWGGSFLFLANSHLMQKMLAAECPCHSYYRNDSPTGMGREQDFWASHELHPVNGVPEGSNELWNAVLAGFLFDTSCYHGTEVHLPSASLSGHQHCYLRIAGVGEVIWTNASVITSRVGSS